MVSSWAIFFIYRSKNIRPRKVYLYNGLSFVQGDKSVAEVSGFILPEYSGCPSDDDGCGGRY